MSHWENKQKNGKEKHGEWCTPKYIFDALNCNFGLVLLIQKDRWMRVAA